MKKGTKVIIGVSAALLLVGAGVWAYRKFAKSKSTEEAIVKDTSAKNTLMQAFDRKNMSTL